MTHCAAVPTLCMYVLKFVSLYTPAHPDPNILIFQYNTYWVQPIGDHVCVSPRFPPKQTSSCRSGNPWYSFEHGKIRKNLPYEENKNLRKPPKSKENPPKTEIKVKRGSNVIPLGMASRRTENIFSSTTARRTFSSAWKRPRLLSYLAYLRGCTECWRQS